MAALCVLHFAELTVQTYQKTRLAKEPEPFFKTVSMKALDYPFTNKAALPRKGQTMNLSITTFKLKDVEVMETHIIPLLWKNISGNNILKTSSLSYHQLKIISIKHLS